MSKFTFFFLHTHHDPSFPPQTTGPQTSIPIPNITNPFHSSNTQISPNATFVFRSNPELARFGDVEYLSHHLKPTAPFFTNLITSVPPS